MADVFISYSKASRDLTEGLAVELQSKGYTVWWDAGLTPGESFSDVILTELDQARAAVVIWTTDSIKSPWVRSEATRASRRGTLIPTRAENVDPNDIPPPFDNLHTEIVSNHAAILAALAKRQILPSRPEQSASEPLSTTKVSEDIALAPAQGITVSQAQAEAVEEFPDAPQAHEAVAGLQSSTAGQESQSSPAVKQIAHLEDQPEQRGFRFSIRGPQDFWGGLALIALAILAIWASRDLPGQRGFAFGPGTAPRLFAGVLAALGAAVALMGVIEHGPRIEKYKFRGPILVIIGILAFAALVRPLGLVPATFVAFVVSILGTTEMRWIESLIAGATMTLFCVLLFVYMLGLPFQLWPRLY